MIKQVGRLALFAIETPNREHLLLLGYTLPGNLRDQQHLKFEVSARLLDHIKMQSTPTFIIYGRYFPYNPDKDDSAVYQPLKL